MEKKEKNFQKLTKKFFENVKKVHFCIFCSVSQLPKNSAGVAQFADFFLKKMKKVGSFCHFF